MRRGAAHLVHRRHARVARATCSRSTGRTASATSSRCAATCRRERSTRASSATRASSSRSSARRPATGSTSTSPRYPECHPQARSPQEDLAAFKRKVDAGANSAITQYFFNPDAYWQLRRRVPRARASPCRSCRASCRSRSYAKLARFSDACGAEIPRWIRAQARRLRRRHRRRSARSASTW